MTPRNRASRIPCPDSSALRDKSEPGRKTRHWYLIEYAEWKTLMSFLICERADSPLMVRGCVFTHFCSSCLTRLMLAPTGQKYLAGNPDTRLICISCYLKLPPDETEHQLTADPETIADELNAIVPNNWRHRN